MRWLTIEDYHQLMKFYFSRLVVTLATFCGYQGCTDHNQSLQDPRKIRNFGSARTRANRGPNGPWIPGHHIGPKNDLLVTHNNFGNFSILDSRLFQHVWNFDDFTWRDANFSQWRQGVREWVIVLIEKKLHKITKIDIAKFKQQDFPQKFLVF